MLRWIDKHRRPVYALLFLAPAFALAGAFVLKKLVAGLPSVDILEDYTPSLTTRVYDRYDQEIYKFSAEENRTLLTLRKIPVDLQNAVIAVEDHKFFEHWGISLRGILRAFLRNIFALRRAQGASTITQQLSRNIFLTAKKTYVRKIREILLALQIERNFSKPEILQLYLNQVYFGRGAYGVQAAGRIFFNKDISQLNLSDCAVLAGLIQLPARYDPFRHPDLAARRRNVVLARMRQMRYITDEEEKAAMEEKLAAGQPGLAAGYGPYFFEYLRQELEPKYGVHAFWKGGLRIYTTMDSGYQQYAEQVMEKHLAAFDAKAAQISTAAYTVQAAFVLMDTRSGAIRAMVGGRDFKTSQFNRAVQARRPPGSTFKPFLWAAAFLNGMTPATVVDDAPRAYYSDGRDWWLLENATDQYTINMATQAFADTKFEVWVPKNFDDKFLGPVTLRRALELSRNMVAVRLIEQVGPPHVVEIAHKLGINSELYPSLSLSLGASVVSPLEMAGAFSTLANGGIRVKHNFIARVMDADGKVLESNAPWEVEAIDPKVAYVLVNLMKGVVEHGTGRYAHRLNRSIAGKTGTTQDNRDLWFVGFSPDVVAAAWMGYDDFSSLGGKGITGGTTVLPWWTEIMEKVLEGYPNRDFTVPDGIRFVKIDKVTGKLALPICPRENQILEAFLPGTQPADFCNPGDYADLQKQSEARRLEEAQKKEHQRLPVPEGITESPPPLAEEPAPLEEEN